jgi:1-acyl-sn-glycerol-3-phosphate acyltransferase
MSDFLGTLRFWRRLVAFIVITIVYSACMEIDGLLHRKEPAIDLINRWVPRWAKVLLRVFGIRVHPHGPHIEGGGVYPSSDARGVGRIFVFNHRSGCDIPVGLAIVLAHPISRHDLATWPILGRRARRVGTLFVDRDSRRSGATVLKQIAAAIAEGEGIAMFPEGTSFPGDEVREFKPGPFTSAERTGAEVVPIGLAYGDKAAYYFKESFMTHMKRVGRLKRLEVAIEAGAPISIEGRSSMEVKDDAHAAVQDLVDRARARLVAQFGEPAREAGESWGGNVRPASVDA